MTPLRQDDPAYREGWFDAHAQIGAALLATLAELATDDSSRRTRYTCHKCDGSLLIGEPIAVCGRDPFGNTLFYHLHGHCPTYPEPQQPQEDPQAPAGVTEAIQPTECLIRPLHAPQERP